MSSYIYSVYIYIYTHADWDIFSIVCSYKPAEASSSLVLHWIQLPGDASRHCCPWPSFTYPDFARGGHSRAWPPVASDHQLVVWCSSAPDRGSFCVTSTAKSSLSPPSKPFRGSLVVVVVVFYKSTHQPSVVNILKAGSSPPHDHE